MEIILNRIWLGLSNGIFDGILKCYQLFVGLASTKLFSSSIIQEVSNRIYIFVSIVILFAFSIKLIEAIVNPDLLTDAKKGVTGVLKRTIIGLLLIIAVPSIFRFVYFVQYEIITESIVEKLVLGYEDTDSSSGINGAGRTLTSGIITGFVVPVDSNGVPITESSVCGTDQNCNYAQKLLDLNADYEEYVPFLGDNPEFVKLQDLTIDKMWDNGTYIYKVNGFILFVVGIFIFYQVILLCFDAALRLIQLGILEMIAPIVIVSYIGGGTDYLSKWASMTVEKFLSIFIRIAALCFMVLGFRLMNSPDSIFTNDSTTFWFKLFVIIGLLRLVKDIPNIINKIFGVNIKGDAGIKGRLGEMAGIGGLAQKAWSGIGATAKAGAKTAGLMAAGGLAGGVKKLDRNFENKTGWSVGKGVRAVSNTKVGKAARVFGAGVKGGGKAGAIGDAAKKVFASEIKDSERKDKEARAAFLNNRLGKASGGILALSADKKQIDFDATIVNAKARGKTALDLNTDVINNTSGMTKENQAILDKYNAKRDASLSAKRKVDNRNELLGLLDNIQRTTKDTDQAAAIEKLKTAVNSGSYSNKNELISALMETASTNQGGLTERSLRESYQSELERLAGKDGDLRLSSAKLQADSVKANTEFDTAEKKYNERLEIASSDEKEIMSKVKDTIDKVHSANDLSERTPSLIERPGAIGGSSPLGGGTETGPVNQNPTSGPAQQNPASGPTGAAPINPNQDVPSSILWNTINNVTNNTDVKVDAKKDETILNQQKINVEGSGTGPIFTEEDMKGTTVSYDSSTDSITVNGGTTYSVSPDGDTKYVPTEEEYKKQQSEYARQIDEIEKREVRGQSKPGDQEKKKELEDKMIELMKLYKGL